MGFSLAARHKRARAPPGAVPKPLGDIGPQAAAGGGDYRGPGARGYNSLAALGPAD